MSLQMYEIYEFYRELIDISQKNGRWVSGGFRSEVAPFNHLVPEKIKDAVNRGDFRINDNYPPEKEQEYALIAREIDEFSVLAVASGEIDDKDRPLVAYRYFWLSKPEENIDGIAILLKWWLNAGKPKFEFLEAQNSNELSYSVIDFSSNFDNNNCEPLNPGLAENSDQIQSYDLLMTNELTKSTLGLFHLLALARQKQSNISLAWAWNVRYLEYPERFNLIYRVDKINHCIVNNIHHGKNSIMTIPHDESSVKPVPEKVQPDEKTSGEIKQCLLDIVNHNPEQREKYLKQLTPYIEQYPIDEWKWKNIIEKEMMKEPWSPAKARYRALLVIFGQIPIDEWLYWLQRQRNDSYEFSSFYLQMQFFKKIPENNEIIELIEAGIINLLLQYTSGSLKPEQYENIEWLLIQSNSIWNVHFKYYARELLKQLIPRQARGNDEFCQKVIETVKNQQFQQGNKLEYHFSEYTRLARIFEIKRNYALSALFYQLSKGKVPSEIFKRDYVQIIPTTQEETNISNEIRQDVQQHRFPIFHFIKSHLEIIILVTVMILGLSAITYIVVQDNFPQLLEQNSK